jgi:hypothetical protein
MSDGVDIIGQDVLGVQPMDNLASGWSTAKLYSVGDKKVPVSQHTDYLHRGTDLATLALVEYVCIIGTVEKGTRRGKKDETDKEPEGEQLHGDGTNSSKTDKTCRRGTNTRYPFMPLTDSDGDVVSEHPLTNSHEQMVQSKVLAPLLAGSSPPSFHCLDGRGDMYKYSNADRYSDPGTSVRTFGNN